MDNTNTHNIYYKIGSHRYTEEEYIKEFGELPQRLSTYEYGNITPKAKFEAYYDGTLRQHLSSYKEQEKAVKEFNRKQKELPPDKRDKAHPDGFEFAQDHSFFKDMKYISKHGKEYRREMQKEARLYQEECRKRPSGKTFIYMGK